MNPVRRSHIIQHAANHSRGAADELDWTDLLQTWSTSGTLAVNAGVARWYPPMAGTLDRCHFSVGVAPTGSTVGVRVNFATAGGAGPQAIGTTTFESGVYAGTMTFTPFGFGTLDYFTVDVYAVGSGTAGGYMVGQAWGRFKNRPWPRGTA